MDIQGYVIMIVETRDKQIKLFGKLDIWSVTVSLIVRMAFLGEICKKIQLSSEKEILWKQENQTIMK